MFIHTRNGRTIIKLGACEANGKIKFGGTTRTEPTAVPLTLRHRMPKQDARPRNAELSVDVIKEIWTKRRADIEASVCGGYTAQRSTRPETTELSVDAIYAARKLNR